MSRITRSAARANDPQPQPTPDDETSSEEEEEESNVLSQSFNSTLSLSQQECSVCLTQIELPIRLPCSHFFCFTCAKGLAQSNSLCAMCRRPIPADFLVDPDKYVVGIIHEPNLEFAWFYEGNNGWWMYEPRVQNEVEEAYMKGTESMEALIAGHLYVIDFTQKLQFRKDHPSKRRRIKRDLASTDHKGLAGLKQERRPEFPPGKES